MTVPQTADGVSVTIDGFEITVPKGTLVIRAAEQLGIQIPRFCDHPLLEPVGACRQCLVHIEGQPKPPASCTTVCTDGMVVRSQLTSPVAEKAQRGVKPLYATAQADCGCSCGKASCSCGAGGGSMKSGSCGCGAKSVAQCTCSTTAKPRGAPVQCEATVICEGFEFEVYRREPPPPPPRGRRCAAWSGAAPPRR